MNSFDEKIMAIVEQSYFFEAQKKMNGKAFLSYNAGFKADLFEEFAKSNALLTRACERYGELMHEKLELLNQERKIINMSAEHICDESLAHLLIWFRWSKKLGFGISYKACEVVDLNIDENRFPISLYILIVRYFRKRKKNKSLDK